MSKKKDSDSLEIMVARIDERVDAIHKHLPAMNRKIYRHDRDLIIARVLFVIFMMVAASKFPIVAEAIARVIGS